MSTATATIAETIRGAFPFTVDKLPLAGPDGLRTPHYGLFRSDSGACVGAACKRGYEPHTVDDICALAEAAQSAFGDDAGARCLFRDGHYVTVAPSVDYRRSIFGSDTIWPRMIIRAGYDGRAFRGELGFYRDACRNMSIIRSAGRSVSSVIRHTCQLRSKMAELVATFTELAAGWDSVVETARAMDARSVDLADFIRQVYPIADDASERTRRAFLRRTELIVRRIMRERQTTGRPPLDIGQRGRVSAWEALNGVQGYVQHDMSRHGRPDDITRAIIALDDAAVNRATELALAV